MNPQHDYTRLLLNAIPNSSADVAPTDEWFVPMAGATPSEGTRAVTVAAAGAGDWLLAVEAARAGPWTVALEQR